MFGMAYMFVHDGLVHRRFTVGPIADFPYLQKVAAAHQVLDFLFGFFTPFFGVCSWVMRHMMLWVRCLYLNGIQ
jgi:hypothetical protein